MLDLNRREVEALLDPHQLIDSLAPAMADLIWPIRDGLITEGHIHAEVGELITGAREGRTSPEQITLYKSVGVAVQDAVAAQLVLTAARERGIGLEVEL